MPDTAHVVPAGDLVEHYVPDSEDATDDDACVCGPAVRRVQGPDGDRWLYVHASLDGRELAEPA